MPSFRSAIVLLAASLSAACKKDPPPPTPAPPAPATGAVVTPPSTVTSSWGASVDASSFSPISGGLVRLECGGIAPIEEAGTCAASPRPTDALVQAFTGKIIGMCLANAEAATDTTLRPVYYQRLGF